MVANKSEIYHKETVRIAIMAGILAIFFGIRQAITEETFEVINMDFALKFLSVNFFQLLLIAYLIYFIVLALSYGYENKIKLRGSKFLFDLIITFTVTIIFLTFSIIGTIWLVIKFPTFIQPGWKTNALIYGSIILATIFFIFNMHNYYKKFKGLFSLNKNIKKGRKDHKIMEKKRSSLGFSGWSLVITSTILLIVFLSIGKYSFAISFGITMFLFILLIWALKINLKEEDYEKAEKKVELNKLRLFKYQTLSVALISIGVGVFLTGQVSGGSFGINTWIGIGMIVVGILIEKFHVETRYRVLEDYYEKYEKKRIK